MTEPHRLLRFWFATPVQLLGYQTRRNREEQTRMRLENSRLCWEQYGMDVQLEDITDCDGARRMGEDCFPSGGLRCPVLRKSEGHEALRLVSD